MPGFAMVTASAGKLDRSPLEMIITDAKKSAPFSSGFVLGAGLISCAKTSIGLHLADMKVVAVLSILCRSAHRNNNNYLSLFIALYLYSAGAKVDAIILLNHLGISVSYNVLQKKLKEIISLSMILIKKQSTNCKLVGSWDNLEYRENVHSKQVEDTVKFKSVTMAF